MTLRTRRGRIRELIEHCRQRVDRNPLRAAPPVVGHDLVILQTSQLEPETARDIDVAAIWGNTEQIDLRCDSCGSYVDEVVNFETKPELLESEFDEQVLDLCAGCIINAAELLGFARPR